jgi:hypothetical protein
MGTVITCPNGNKMQIHKVGYLFGNSKYVKYFHILESDKPFAVCRMETVFSNGRIIISYFESLAAAYELINNPIFWGRRYYWFGRGYEIKADSEKTLQPQET